MPATNKSQPVHAASGPGRPEHAPASAHAAVDVIALTTRDDFLLELGQCLEGTAAIAPVESSALALAAVAKSRCVQVLVVDSRDIAELRTEIDLLQARAPTLTTLVFAGEDSEVKVAAALKGSNVFAVLPLPIDDRKTAAVFEGAVAEAEKKRSAVQAAAVEARPAAVSEPGGIPHPEANAVAAESELASREESAGGGKTRIFALAGIACAVVATVAAWLLMREQPPAPASPAPASQTAGPARAEEVAAIQAPPAIAGTVDELLEKARIAMRERRYLEPANNSALEYYRSAAGVDPGNDEALAGLNRLQPLIVARFEELTKAGRHDDAARSLAQLESAVPADPSIANLRQRLATARVAKAIEEEDVERASALVRDAQATNAVSAAQLTKWRAEIARLNEKVSQERLAGQKAREAAAEKKAREARAAVAAREAQAAREREEAKKLEEERASQAALAAAKSAETEANARKASTRVEPKLKRQVEPEFPREALDRGISGVVIVAYTVDAEGKTQDVRVESAQPPEVFDRAAIAAVRRWRYEPATVDGVPTEAQLQMKIRFTLPK